MDCFGFSLCIQVDRATQNCDSQVKVTHFGRMAAQNPVSMDPYFYVVHFASSKTCRYDQ